MQSVVHELKLINVCGYGLEQFKISEGYCTCGFDWEDTLNKIFLYKLEEGLEGKFSIFTDWDKIVG